MGNTYKYGKIVFTVLFVGALLVYSAANFLNAGDILAKEVKESKFTEVKQDIQEINTAVEENVLGRYGMVEAYGALQMAMGKKEENSFHNVKDKSGYLYSGNFWAGHGENQKILAVRMRRLMEKMEKKGTKVAFVLNPEKTVREGMEYPGIPYDSYEKEADDIIRWLDYYSVPYLDLRDTMKRWSMSYEDIWFKTDHHWTPRAAFEGYKDIVGWLNSEFQAGLDPGYITRDLENYDVITYPDIMLGSNGRDMGILYSGGMEDYTVLIPKEDGRYKWRFENGGKQEGTFREAFLQEDIMNPDPYKLNAGKFYMYELTSYSSQINYNIKDGKKILFLRDSFATPVGAFLSQNVSRTDMLWSQDYSEEEIEEYLNGEEYDYVIVMLLPNNLNSKSFPFCVEQDGQTDS